MGLSFLALHSKMSFSPILALSGGVLWPGGGGGGVRQITPPLPVEKHIPGRDAYNFMPLTAEVEVWTPALGSWP